MKYLSTDYLYIFLDMDGVLNSRKWRISQGLAKTWPPGEYRDISIEMLQILRRIIDLSPMRCRIIFSSQARIAMDETDYGEYIRSKFKEVDLELFDVTPNINAKRADEIKSYLDHNFEDPSACKFVIIDDEQIYDYIEHQIKTSYEKGLTEDHIHIAEILMYQLFKGGKGKMNVGEAKELCVKIDQEMCELRKKTLHRFDDIADQARDVAEFSRDYLDELNNPQDVEDLLIRIEGIKVQADNLQKAYVNAKEKSRFERGR